MPPHRASTVAPDTDTYVRREYEELHPKDQQLKQTKKLCIEKNWECPIERCLPAEIRPRIELRKGAKARVGDPDVADEIWWNWSVEFLKALEEMSSMTEGQVNYAGQLLMIEVDLRQRNPRSSQRKIRELLLGDVQKVVDQERKKLAIGYHNDVMQDAGEGGPMHNYQSGDYLSDMEYRHGEGPPAKRARRYIDTPYHDQSSTSAGNLYDTHSIGNLGMGHGNESALLRRPRPSPFPVGYGADMASNPSGDMDQQSLTGSPYQGSVGNEGLSLKSLELKARAKRGRVAQLQLDIEYAENEAAELEAKVKEMREELERQK
ncbi:hypothetical protein CAC42_594 [Sphaceloma murrayae]|uniref:Uncharacterized protein n=1 Tax=Sphaceloma murrayae TaxID=2082308 RepID=A0A2K1R3X8_9PEZI|nr:hypothetical protein CAC42_594 [Sphaceloma murrayae]